MFARQAMLSLAHWRLKNACAFFLWNPTNLLGEKSKANYGPKIVEGVVDFDRRKFRKLS